MAGRTQSAAIYNGAAAYDLYQGSASRERLERKPLPEERKRPRAQKQSAAIDLTAVVCVAAAFCALLVMLFSYVRAYEVNTKYSAVEKEYQQLLEQKNQLMSQYDSMIDLQAIEREATERLGMTKPFGGQTIYVNLSGTDRGEVVDAKHSVFEDAALLFHETFAELGAYLSE